MSDFKILECSVQGCSNTVQASKFASAQTVKCDACKRVAKKMGDSSSQLSSGSQVIGMPIVGSASVGSASVGSASVGSASVGSASVDTIGVGAQPIKVSIVRNRQELEAIITFDNGTEIVRVPAEVKKIVNTLDYLSVSKMSTYKQCPYKFNRLYMNVNGGLDDDSGNIFTWFGSILHEVAEVAERDYYDSGVIPNVLELFDTAWRKRPLTDIVMYKEARELIIDYFKRNPVGSGEFAPIIVDSSGRTAIEIEWRGPLGEVLEFGCMFDYIGWRTLDGTRITKSYDELTDEDFDNIVGIIKDYKSNRHPFTNFDLENSIQLASYEIIGRILFPKIKYWRTGYELFRFGWQECPMRSLEDLDAVQGYINNIWHQISHDNSWVAKLSPYCGYCSERTECKKYCDFVNNPKVLIDTIVTGDGSLESIEEQREKVSAMYKILGDRKSELDSIMKLAVEQATLNGTKIVIGGQEMYLQSQNRPSYSYSAARNVMALHGKINELDNCLTINKTKLDAIAKANPQLNEALKQCLINSYTAPYINKRKVK